MHYLPSHLLRAHMFCGHTCCLHCAWESLLRAHTFCGHTHVVYTTLAWGIKDWAAAVLCWPRWPKKKSECGAGAVYNFVAASLYDVVWLLIHVNAVGTCCPASGKHAHSSTDSPRAPCLRYVSNTLKVYLTRLTPFRRTPCGAVK